MECTVPFDIIDVNDRRERRKAQNREAQRKFRSKRQEASQGQSTSKSSATNSLPHSPYVATSGSDAPESISGLPANTPYHVMTDQQTTQFPTSSAPHQYFSASEADLVHADMDLPSGSSVSHNMIYASQSALHTHLPAFQSQSSLPLEPPSANHSPFPMVQMTAGNNSSSESASVYGSDWSPWVSKPPSLAPGAGEACDWNLPLHIAAERGHESTVRTLIEGGVDVNECDSSGSTALHIAVLNRHEGVLKILLENGAGVNAHNGVGWTPVHEAAENGFTAGLRLLLEYGGNLTLKARKKL